MASRAPLLVFAVSLMAFIALAMGDIATTSPVYDEPIHLASGYTQLTTGDARFALDHPPLLKRLAALPLVFGKPIWPEQRRAGDERALALLQREWGLLPNVTITYALAKQLFFGERGPGDFLNDARAIFFRARTTLLFSTGVVLASLVFAWSYELWGAWAAAFSALLFCFDPNFIAHSGLVTTDAGAVTLMFATVYFFWRATRGRAWLNGAMCALCFAAAILSKFSAVLLGPMLLLLIPWGEGRAKRTLILVAAIVVTFIGTWAIFGFRYDASSAPMRVEEQVAWWAGAEQLLAQHPEGPPIGAEIRFDAPRPLTARAVLLADRLHLFPKQFLYGFALLRAHSLARGAFLRGQYSMTGFRSYFLWTFLYKTPLVTMLAIAAGLVFAMRNRAVAYLLVPVFVYLAVSMTTSINIGHRHLLVIYPFLYVAAGALAARYKIVLAAAPLIVASALVVFAPWQPVVNQHLAYFNELAGGPLHGGELLTDSNVDWGQDLPRLADWLHERNVREPINLVYFGTAEPRAYGIRYVVPERGFVPGYVAMSATALCAPDEPDHDLWVRRLRQSKAKLAGRAGYSILIYELTSPAARATAATPR